ncbi:MAG: hypothetical protein IKT46_00365 [Clostridia bacterium]|nr:hypothetical protein [Clostridia bacterium]
MFGKLLKHELRSYLRVLLPVELILIGIALIGRLVQLFESDSLIYSFMLTSALLAFFAAWIISTILIAILCVVRFYKNLFTGEGYLTFTLPVTTGQHLWVKIIGATAAGVISMVATLISLFIICDTELLIEIFKVVIYLSKLAMDYIGINYIFFIIEIVISLFISGISQNLLIYACIAIGQTARKHRILWAIGVYFIHYLITQTISVAFQFISSVLSITGIFERFADFITKYYMEFTHCMLTFSSLIQLAICGVYFIITYFIIHKKLNLE